MRSHYWTISKFADWVRGTPTLKAGTADEWDAWEVKARVKKFRYWLAETGIDYAQKVVFFIPDALHSIKYYVNNRWVTKTHALTANPRDIKRGAWRDVGDRFLPCLFNELQDFVETELAWWHIAWADKDVRAKYETPWYAYGWFRWRTWRCPQAGLDNLEWQRNLVFEKEECGDRVDLIGKPTPQAVKAQEILDLYNWWTQVYRNRPDPMDASGWSQYCDDCSAELGGGVMSMFKDHDNTALKKRGDKAHKLLAKIEAAYEKEEEAMMIRLIKVRHGLWT